jgi:hypothetical protein
MTEWVDLSTAHQFKVLIEEWERHCDKQTRKTETYKTLQHWKNFVSVVDEETAKSFLHYWGPLLLDADDLTKNQKRDLNARLMHFDWNFQKQLR